MMGMKQFIHSYLSSLTFTYSDVLEIIILSFVVYHILIWIRNTRAWTLMKGILVMIVFIFIATLLNLDSILFLVSKGINAILVATAVIFQPELRKALEQIGSQNVLTTLFSTDDTKKNEDFSLAKRSSFLRCYRLIWKKMQRNVSATRPSTSW